MSDPNVPPPPGGTPPPPPPPPGGMPPAAPPPSAPPPAAPPPGGMGGGGGFTPPPAQPYSGGGGQMPQLEVGAAISYGWKKFTENVGPFLLLMLVVLIVSAVLNGVQFVVSGGSDSFVVRQIIQGIFVILIYAASMIVQAGVYRAGLAVTRGETPEVSMLTRTDNILPFILTSILVGIGFGIGFIFCFIPGFIWLIFTAYAPILALDKGLDPIEAITTSFNLVKDNFGKVFAILLVSYLVYIAGVCVCGVGVLVSGPVALVAIIYSYRALNNEPVAP